MCYMFTNLRYFSVSELIWKDIEILVNQYAYAKEVSSISVQHKYSKSKHKNGSDRLLNIYFYHDCFSVHELYQICSILDMYMNCLYLTDRSKVPIDTGLPILT